MTIASAPNAAGGAAQIKSERYVSRCCSNVFNGEIAPEQGVLSLGNRPPRGEGAATSEAAEALPAELLDFPAQGVHHVHQRARGFRDGLDPFRVGLRKPVDDSMDGKCRLWKRSVRSWPG